MENNSHDNSVNVKLNNRITVYGNVFILSGASILLVGFLFLAIFMHAYWTQAVTLATVVIYGLVAALFVAISALLRGLWLKVVTHPTITAQERKEALRDQQRKSRLIWAQNNCLIYEEEGVLIPVFPEHPLLIEAPKTVAQEDAKINEALVLRKQRDE